MFSPVASTIFAYRNAEKTKNGDLGRSVVTVGQCTGVFKEVAKYDNIFAATARSALKAFQDVAKDNKALGYAGKCLQFTADHVNPLICASGALKVAMSDDKVHTGIVEASALAGMFAGEALMKEHLTGVFSETAFKSAAKKAADKNIMKSFAETVLTSKYTGKAAGILKGIVFVCGSIASYAVAQKVGENYAAGFMDYFGIKRKESPKVQPAEKMAEKSDEKINQKI